jgi:hypothetical protein
LSKTETKPWNERKFEMNNSMKRYASLLALVLAMCGPVFAQQNNSNRGAASEKEKELQGGVTALLAPQCFTSGSGESFVQVCITERGNISRFESPQGVVHLNTREGYVLTSSDGDPEHPQTIKHGFDAGSGEAGWGVPTVFQPNGPGTLPLIITRTSLDGDVQLTQTFTLNPAERGVDIKMDVKNISPVTLGSVDVSRYFDVDMNGSAFDDIYDAGRVAVWGHTKAIPNGASFETLTLAGAPSSFALYFPVVETFADWNPNGSKFQTARGNSGPGPEPTPTVSGDFVGRLLILVGDIAPGQTKSVTVRYRRF